MRKQRKRTRVATRAALACVVAFSLVALPACSSPGQDGDNGSSSSDTSETSSQDSEQTAQASYTEHGSTYEKTENVAVSTTLDGNVTGIAVDEWIKNPKGLKTISDKSTLQQITPDNEDQSFTQNGTNVTWKTDTEDVKYSGTTDQKLPFEINYTYRLNGKKIDPSKLKNVSGKLSVTISYKNKANATVKVDDKDQQVKLPYLMASMISFDTAHAKNIKVDHGTTIDQQGSTIAVGVDMPSLAKTLGVDDKVDLPEKVTITAKVKGFDMPNITTMATDQALSAISGKTDDAEDSIDELFGQVEKVDTAVGSLSKGTAAVSQAISKISAGQDKLNAALPKVSAGIDGLGTASSGLGTAVSSSKDKVDAALTSQTSALQSLSKLDTSTMTDEQKAAIASAVGDLQTAQQDTAVASKGLEAAGTTSAKLSQGLEQLNTGLSQIQTGYDQLGTATAKVSTASSQVSAGAEKMKASLSSQLDMLRDTVDSKIALVNALGKEVDKQGAFCGNADSMPASTTFTVTASATGGE